MNLNVSMDNQQQRKSLETIKPRRLVGAHNELNFIDKFYNYHPLKQQKGDHQH